MVLVVQMIHRTACLSRRVLTMHRIGWQNTWEQAPGVPGCCWWWRRGEERMEESSHIPCREASAVKLAPDHTSKLDAVLVDPCFTQCLLARREEKRREERREREKKRGEREKREERRRKRTK